VKIHVFLSLFLLGCGSSAPPTPGPPWLENAKILVMGEGVTNEDCRNAICQHNENTDMVSFRGVIYLVHRTAKSQVLGPNSSLHIYRSADEGRTFDELSIIQAPSDRDLRDPCFYTVGTDLYIKALTRLPVTSTRDSNVDTITVAFKTSDGSTWTSAGTIGPTGWSFWRIQKLDGIFYSAAYADGDKSVALFTSPDGLVWTRGADVYTVSADTPLETELVFLPTKTLLAFVRMDGTDAELLGDMGRLRTKVCVALPPYTSFDCPSEITGQRFDGPLAFFVKDRLFMVARKHLQPSLRKRTSVFELSGDLEHGMVDVKEWGEIPSAGDTSYAGGVAIDASRVLLSWYSSDIVRDENWVLGILGETDIWTGTLNVDKLR
jgi:hypothetical protein